MEFKCYESIKEKLNAAIEDEAKVNELIDFVKKEVPKEFVPSDKLKEAKSELEAATKKLEETNSTIEELKNNTESIEEYKIKLDKLNQEHEQFKSEADKRVERIRKESIIKDNLIKNNADPDTLDLLMYEFDGKYDEMTLKDDNIVGLDDYINPVKEKREKLFLKNNVVTPKPEDGDAGDSNKEMAAIDAAMGL